MKYLRQGVLQGACYKILTRGVLQNDLLRRVKLSNLTTHNFHACRQGSVTWGMLRRASYQGRATKGMYTRFLPSVRACYKGRVTNGVLQRACYKGHVSKGVLQRACYKGRVTKGMLQTVRYEGCVTKGVLHRTYYKGRSHKLQWTKAILLMGAVVWLSLLHISEPLLLWPFS